jgi:hypothetical protein
MLQTLDPRYGTGMIEITGGVKVWVQVVNWYLEIILDLEG